MKAQEVTASKEADMVRIIKEAAAKAEVERQDLKTQAAAKLREKEAELVRVAEEATACLAAADIQKAA